MDAVDPPLLTAIRSLRWMINAGRTPRDAVRIYLDENGDDVAQSLRHLWVRMTSPDPLTPIKTGIYRRALWELIERGVAGEPILDALGALEDEVHRAAKSELDLHLTVLPFKMLIPLLAFQFPAHLILLLGPALGELTRAMAA